MYCPVNDCNERTLGKKTWQYSLRKEEEDYFKFVCKDKHLWYLVVLNGEPLHWLSQDLEVNMPTVNGKKYAYTVKGKAAAKAAKRKKMKKK